MKAVLLYLSCLMIFSGNIYAQNNNTLIHFEEKGIIDYYDFLLLQDRTIDSLKNENISPDTKSRLQKRKDNFPLEQKDIISFYLLKRRHAVIKTRSLNGGFSFEFNHNVYDAVIVDPGKQSIKMHWQDTNGNAYKNLSNLKTNLEHHNQKVLMLTNGGMYLKNNIPQGLFIANGKQLRPVNTRNSTFGNFYMKPNGIFYLNAKGAYVSATNRFMQTDQNKDCIYATQSGPMLVIDGEIHPKFMHRSQNLHLRSGVGVLNDGRVVFIISRSNKTNFHDFAVIFSDLFGCENALYLDGAISRMYLKGIREQDLGGDFGAIISVTQ